MSDYTLRQLQDSLIAAGVFILNEDTSSLRWLAEQMGVGASDLAKIEAAIAEALAGQTAVLSVHLPVYTAYRAAWQAALHDARQSGYNPHEGLPAQTHQALHELNTRQFNSWKNAIAAPKAHYQALLSRVFRLCEEAGLGVVTGWLSAPLSAFEMTAEQLRHRHGLG